MDTGGGDEAVRLYNLFSIHRLSCLICVVWELSSFGRVIGIMGKNRKKSKTERGKNRQKQSEEVKHL